MSFGYQVLGFGSVAGLPPITASGGTKTTSGDYTIHTFNSSGTFTISAGTGDVEYLVVAGAGGGAGLYGAGGAGGYRSSVVGESSGGNSSAETVLNLSSGDYTVTVGAGGAATAFDGQTVGTQGSNSVFSSITSTGGGGGGGGEGDNGVGRDGGSGGGGSDWGNGAFAGGAATANQGSAGGRGNPGTGESGGGDEIGGGCTSIVTPGGNSDRFFLCFNLSLRLVLVSAGKCMFVCLSCVGEIIAPFGISSGVEELRRVVSMSLMTSPRCSVVILISSSSSSSSSSLLFCTFSCSFANINNFVSIVVNNGTIFLDFI